MAQYKIDGIVLDNQQKVVVGATITFSCADDTTVLVRTSSDSIGRFRVRHLNYDSSKRLLLQISHINFYPYKQYLSNRDSVAIINLIPDSVSLEEVTVVAQKPRFMRSGGKFIFNVTNTTLVTGKSIWDVLKNTPLIDISQSNKITLIGSGVSIFINDRPVQLDDLQLMQYLSNMPGDNVVRIEIYPVAPARYQSNGAVINIVLRKSETDGIKGSLTLTDHQSFYNSYSGSFFINFHRNKYTQAVTINGGRNKIRSTDDITNTILNSPQYYRYDIFSVTRKDYWNASTTIDYNLNAKNSVGGMIQFQGSGNRIDKQSVETQYTNNNQTNAYQNFMPTAATLSLFAGNMYYTYQNEKNKELFQISVDLLNSRTPIVNDFLSFNPPANNLVSGIRTRTADDIKKYSLQLDNKKTIFKTLEWELGAKANASKVQSPFDYFNSVNNEWKVNTMLSNFFTYKEKINSLYSTFASRFGKFDAKLGARVEVTSLEFGQKPLSAHLSNSYTNFIPVLNLGYSLNQNNLLSFDLGSYPIRPAYSSLNPFIYNLGNNFYQTGNPYLKASPSLITSLTYVLQQNYIFSLQYLDLSKSIIFTNIYSNDSIISKPFNGGNDKVLIFNSVVNLPAIIKKSLRFTISQKFVFNNSEDFAPQLHSSVRSFSYNLKINGDFNLPKKGLQGYITAQYLPPTNFGYLRWESIFTVDAGITKIFDKPGIKINLQFNNITRFGLRSSNKNNYIYNFSHNYAGDQGIGISFVKSFGNKKSKDVKQKYIDQSRLGKDSKTKR